MRDEPDAAVVARVLGGDTEAFGVLLRRYEPELLRFAQRLLGDPDAAGDAVAEGLVRAYRHLASCRDPARLRPWLYRIVANRCKTQLARRRADDIPLEDAPPLAAAADSAAELEQAERLARVEQALARLAPDKREAFVLRHVQGLGYEEMAAVTGATVTTLRMRVHRAREALAALLKEDE